MKHKTYNIYFLKKNGSVHKLLSMFNQKPTHIQVQNRGRKKETRVGVGFKQKWKASICKFRSKSKTSIQS